MTPEQFCYWLQGMLELTNPSIIGQNQTTMIKNHLNTVFMNITDYRRVVTPLPFPPQSPFVVVPPIIDRNDKTVPVPCVLPQGPYC